MNKIAICIIYKDLFVFVCSLVFYVPLKLSVVVHVGSFIAGSPPTRDKAQVQIVPLSPLLNFHLGP